MVLRLLSNSGEPFSTRFLREKRNFRQKRSFRTIALWEFHTNILQIFIFPTSFSCHFSCLFLSFNRLLFVFAPPFLLHSYHISGLSPPFFSGAYTFCNCSTYPS